MSLSNPSLLWLILPIGMLMAAVAVSDRRRRQFYCRVWSPIAKSVIAFCILLVLAGPTHLIAPPASTSPNQPQAVVYLDPRPWHPPQPVLATLLDLRRVGALRAVVSLPPPPANSAPATAPATAPAPTLVAVDLPTATGSVEPSAWPWQPPGGWPRASAFGGADPTRAVVPDGIDVTVWPVPLARFAADWERVRREFTTVGRKTVHIFAEAPPSVAQQELLAAAGVSWQFHPLPAPETVPQAVLGAIETVPPAPEAQMPFRIRLPLIGRLDGAAKWRLIVNGVPSAWTPVAAQASAETRPIALESPELRWPAGPHAVRVEVAIERSADSTTPPRTLAAFRGVDVRPTPRWFALPDYDAASAVGARWVAEMAQAGDVVLDVHETFPNLMHYAGAVIPVSRLARLSDAELGAIRLFVEYGGGLIVPCYAPTTTLTPREQIRLAGLLPVQIGDPSAPAGRVGGVREHDEEGDIARVSVVFMIDNSGSMNSSVGPSTRTQFVRTAVKEALKNLDERDRVAVGFFNNRVAMVGPMPATAENKARLLNEVDRWPDPTSLTAIARACVEAQIVLENEAAAIKHVVLLSDGEETVTPFVDFTDIRRRFIAANISCTVVGIGESDVETLRKIHTPGHGAAIFSDARAGADYYRLRMPQIFIREVRDAQHRADQILADPKHHGQEPNQPLSARRGQYEIFKDTPSLDYLRVVPVIPPVLGTATLVPLPRAMTVLTARLAPHATDEFGRPLDLGAVPRETPALVSWRVGLGEVAAFGPALTPEALPDWFDWPEASRFVAAWLRALANPRPGLFALSDPQWTPIPPDGQEWEFAGKISPIFGPMPGPGWAVAVDAVAPYALEAVSSAPPTVHHPLSPSSRGAEEESMSRGGEPLRHRLFRGALPATGEFRVAVPREVLLAFAAVDVVIVRLLSDGTPDPYIPPMLAHRELLPPPHLTPPAVTTAGWALPTAAPVAKEVAPLPPPLPPAPVPRPATDFIVAVLMLAAVLLVGDVFLRR